MEEFQNQGMYFNFHISKRTKLLTLLPRCLKSLNRYLYHITVELGNKELFGRPKIVP